MCDARLVCKAVRDDCEINLFFGELKKLMRKWNTLRDGVRDERNIPVVFRGNSFQFLTPLMCQTCERGKIRSNSDGEIMYYLLYSHKHNFYEIRMRATFTSEYIIEEVFSGAKKSKR